MSSWLSLAACFDSQSPKAPLSLPTPHLCTAHSPRQVVWDEDLHDQRRLQLHERNPLEYVDGTCCVATGYANILLRFSQRMLSFERIMSQHQHTQVTNALMPTRTRSDGHLQQNVLGQRPRHHMFEVCRAAAVSALSRQLDLWAARPAARQAEVPPPPPPPPSPPQSRRPTCCHHNQFD